MEWRDEGIILGARKYGETSVVLETMTAAHGRHLGLVKGGRSRRMQPLLQPGNRVDLVWRARLEEHLGAFQVEPLELNAARLLASAVAIHGIQLLAAHLRLMPERDAHAGLYETLKVITAHLDEPEIAGPLMVRFELALLDELGFGLDLGKCALTGSREGLAYVSPKSGRAVTQEAGTPWRDKLLPLPAFLTTRNTAETTREALDDAYRLTGFFFHRNVYEPRGMEEPDARGGFLMALARSAERAAD
ncbi:DNA repair protein RecO [Nitratireductor aquimarinus]|uniref:DNA repair protein RecO n=1 Tax=Alphaproteobacteria TaxID=28211 RepID=UPI0019D36490|nr:MULTISPECIES: DNA repair protein RecO [Alphaproteobacteria]MBN7756021.1 DNA repair protein RecO [Nitratireductor aquimarinus]MBY5998779.1 DNA repair protein RecO [Tritonibacter mobilis]MBY6020807.1 DNA repair protein RecO [Nitratireductor sp. DP7N14-4]